MYQTEARPGALATLVELRARFPRARLTGLGAGLMTMAVSVAIGSLDAVLFSGSPGVYGFFFLLISAACAGWVRQADLIVGPVAAPIAFAAGVFCISDRSVMGYFSTLSLQAGWLYTGTAIAVLIALVRRIVYMTNRRR